MPTTITINPEGMSLLQLIHEAYSKESPSTPPFDSEWVALYLEGLMITDYECLTNTPSPHLSDIVRIGV